MDNKAAQTPTPEQIRLIFKETYNFFTKYNNIHKDEEWEELIKKTHELYKKYPFKLCEKLLVELLEVIEKYNKEKSSMESSETDKK